MDTTVYKSLCMVDFTTLESLDLRISIHISIKKNNIGWKTILINYIAEAQVLSPEEQQWLWEGVIDFRGLESARKLVPKPLVFNATYSKMRKQLNG